MSSLVMLLAGAAPDLFAQTADAVSEGERGQQGAWQVRSWQGWKLRATRCSRGEAHVACEGGVVARRGAWWVTADEVTLETGARMALLGRVRIFGPSLTIAAPTAAWERGSLEEGRIVADEARMWREDRWLGADRVSVTMDDGRVQLEALRSHFGMTKRADDAT